MIKIYCDGIFDLFHKGHLNHFKKIHSLFNEPIYLIVGIINDKISTDYKRNPIYNENQRYKMISSIIYVNEAIITDMLVIDENFLNKYKIDYVVHAFGDNNDKNKQNLFFEVPIKLNKFIEIPYNNEISTTELINKYLIENNNNNIDENKFLNWNEIWEKRGNEDITDLYILNGWDETIFDPKLLIEKIINILNIQENEKIIEYGCGSGLLSLFLKKYNYYGLDYSTSLVLKHIKLLNNICFNFSSSEKIFKDNYFDYVIINSMLEYLTSIEELNKTILEIERISKKGIYIANIRKETRSSKISKNKYNGEYSHFIIQPEYFINLNYIICESLYDNQRYDVYKIV